MSVRPLFGILTRVGELIFHQYKSITGKTNDIVDVDEYVFDLFDVSCLVSIYWH